MSRKSSTRRRGGLGREDIRGVYQRRLTFVRSTIKGGSTFRSVFAVCSWMGRAAFTDCLRALGYRWTGEKGRLTKRGLSPVYSVLRRQRAEYGERERKRRGQAAAIIDALRRAKRKSVKEGLRERLERLDGRPPGRLDRNAEV